MDGRLARAWFTAASIVLTGFGVLYVVAGLKILPVDRVVLVDWESGLYGAIMIGWGVTLLFVGRIAFLRRDRQLFVAMLAGIGVWLLVEAVVSLRYGVLFNAAVDVGVLAVFAIPIMWTMKRSTG